MPAPLIAELPIGLRLPIVVLEIALGSAVGPHGLGLARAEGVLGTLLPILRDAGELETPFGSFVVAAGAVGELGPILAISVVLTHDSSCWTQTALMLGFVMIASVAILVALRVHPPAAVALFARSTRRASSPSASASWSWSGSSRSPAPSGST